MSQLRPQKNVHKYLISTPSRLNGEYETDDILVTHAWAYGGTDKHLLGLDPGPYSRNYFVVAFSVEPKEIAADERPIYAYHYAERICAALCVLYGKRFDLHGAIESDGFYMTPDLGGVRPLDLCRSGPFNHTPRPDLGIPLGLPEIGRIVPLVLNITDKFADVFFAAARFYHRSLQIFDLEPDVAYLDLITCGEILSAHYQFTDERLFDQNTLDLLKEVREKIGDGAANNFRQRMFQVKRRFALALMHLLNDLFFSATDARTPELGLQPSITSGLFKNGKVPITFERRLKAAYDLRSRYVHTGFQFAKAVRPSGGDLNEIHWGKPICGDAELDDIVYQAPTYLGLERIMRYALLRHVHLSGVPIDSKLDGVGLTAAP